MESTDSVGFVFDLMCLALADAPSFTDLVSETIAQVDQRCPVTARVSILEGTDDE